MSGLRSPSRHLQFSGDDIKCLYMVSQYRWRRSSGKRIRLWLSDHLNFQYGFPVIFILQIVQDGKSWMLHSSSYWGRGRELVSLLFHYKGSQYIKQRQWCSKVNNLQLTVGYLNATINGITRKPEPEIGIHGSSQTRQNRRVDRYRYGIGLPSNSR